MVRVWNKRDNTPQELVKKEELKGYMKRVYNIDIGDETRPWFINFKFLSNTWIYLKEEV